jgi:hypothetical protein
VPSGRGRLWHTARVKRPDPIQDPTYNWPTARTSASATPAEKALAALKVGALLAGSVTIAFIYLRTYAGVELPIDLLSALVLAAFSGPSLVVYLVARRRGKGRER